MAEKFGFKQGLGNRATVELDVRLAFAARVEVNQVRYQFFAGAGFSLDQSRSLRIGDAQRQFDRATNCRRLADDPVFAIAFVQGALQAHDFGREVIALQRGANLIGYSFDQGDLVIFETIALPAPDPTEQSERVPGNAYRRHQRRASAERGIENSPQWKRQVGVEKFERLAVR